jgi:mono/diheme cytochrome c family protein
MRSALAGLLLAATSLGAAAGDARFNYLMECRGCHAADGSGSVSSVPSLKGRMAKFLTVPGGREFLVQVPGAAQAPLDDAALAEVLNWMLREFGPTELAGRYPPYGPEEVARLRRTPLTEIGVTRAALVRQIGP